MTRATLIACALVLLPLAASAAARVDLIESVNVIELRERVPVALPMHGSAKPGQRLRYTIVAKNNGDRPAAGLVPLQKIPAGERFIAGSASTGAEYSADGGKTFAREPIVRIANPAPGTPATRPALASEYTTVRWNTTAPLAPGERLTFSFDVTIE